MPISFGLIHISLTQNSNENSLSPGHNKQIRPCQQETPHRWPVWPQKNWKVLITAEKVREDSVQDLWYLDLLVLAAFRVVSLVH